MDDSWLTSLVAAGTDTSEWSPNELDDDPLPTAEERGRAPGRGGKGIVMVTGDAAHGWNVRRDIKLGERVPGYPS